jgi:GNAT superfamily N-acetyltransferase
MGERITIRRATADDVEVITHQRRAMFEAMGLGDPATRDAMDVAFGRWARAKIAERVYLGWLAQADDGVIAAGAGLWLMDWIPGPVTLLAPRGYILNVYTEPAYRKRGLATRLVNAILEWCRANGITLVSLHASDAGRAVYEALGFRPTNEMQIRLL